MRIIGGGNDNDLYSTMGTRYSEYVAYAKKKRVRKYLIGPGPPTDLHKQRFLKEGRNQVRYLKHGLSTPTFTRITPELVTMEIFGFIDLQLPLDLHMR